MNFLHLLYRQLALNDHFDVHVITNFRVMTEQDVNTVMNMDMDRTFIQS